MGYPGNVTFEAIYTLTGNRLRLEMSGVPDRPTPISLVQHQYFNLGATDTVLDHVVHLPDAVARTVAGADLIQTGAIIPVANTIDDFLSPRNMRFGAGRSIDYDLNYLSQPAATWPSRSPSLLARMVRSPSGSIPTSRRCSSTTAWGRM